MKLFFEFLPIIVFFIFYKLGGLILATQAILITTLMNLVLLRIRMGVYPRTQLISFFILLILGGTTLLLRNELFIKCKPTIVCWSCGLMFFGSHFVGSKLLIQRLNYGRFDFPLVVWEKLNTSWAIFCMLMGAINLYIIYNFNTDVWINFKLFGATAVTGIYMIAQLTYVTYYLKFPIRPFR